MKQSSHRCREPSSLRPSCHEVMLVVAEVDGTPFNNDQCGVRFRADNQLRKRAFHSEHVGDSQIVKNAESA